MWFVFRTLSLLNNNNPIQTKFVEAFSSKENIKSQEILKHLGLNVIGENKNGKSLHFTGEYKALLNRYSVEI